MNKCISLDICIQIYTYVQVDIHVCMCIQVSESHMCCSVLQCVAVCCSVLQCMHVHTSKRLSFEHSLTLVLLLGFSRNSLCVSEKYTITNSMQFTQKNAKKKEKEKWCLCFGFAQQPHLSFPPCNLSETTDGLFSVLNVDVSRC